MSGRLFLCSTPIGNLGDVSARLAETLATVDRIYAEDTRRSRQLLASLGVDTPMRSFFVGNESQRASEMESALSDGMAVALVTDAGTPGVSDPGRAAVAAARSAGAEVVVVPGPSAVTAIVAASGMVINEFVFAGFLERKGKARSGQLEAICREIRPTVLFLSPHRVVRDLQDLGGACGAEREVCVGRELTKLHEEVWWGTLGSAVERWSDETPRGEFVAVVAPAPEASPTLEQAVEMARALMEEGASTSHAAKEAAGSTGVSRREIYAALVTSGAGPGRSSRRPSL